MILDIFPTPLYLERLQSYDKQSMITAVNTIYNIDNNSFFGDSKNTVQIHNHESFEWLNSQVKEHTLNYLRQSGYTDNVNVVVQKSWAVVLGKGGGVQTHNHPNSHLSGVLWIKIPDESSKFRFTNPMLFQRWQELEHYTSEFKAAWNVFPTFHFTPKEGRLMLFPSDLDHEVLQNESEEDRISYSFNITLVHEK